MGKLHAAVVGMGTTASVEDVLDLVRRQGGRATHSRRLLLRALFDSSTPHTVEELAELIQREAPEVHLSTIYRNLDDLVQLGVVVRGHLGSDAATYHLAVGKHGYLVCGECGSMTEVSAGLLSVFSQSLLNQFGFEVNSNHLVVPGRCQACTTDASRRCS
jgi:Fur family ferric uptake transcriptional regulator